ncbi:hypothetical protein EVAR_6950_1 [Eumeta japonica]|uniref:Uncharacterized protein n=1 Tax=Eumeta variegata TaxID=151549 RepID=A0A4C1TGK2_EUMVA|nr:hypothetical protein EVAR_6950_1 [Eumeta japonica]
MNSLVSRHYVIKTSLAILFWIPIVVPLSGPFGPSPVLSFGAGLDFALSRVTCSLERKRGATFQISAALKFFRSLRLSRPRRPRSGSAAVSDGTVTGSIPNNERTDRHHLIDDDAATAVGGQHGWLKVLSPSSYYDRQEVTSGPTSVLSQIEPARLLVYVVTSSILETITVSVTTLFNGRRLIATPPAGRCGHSAELGDDICRMSRYVTAFGRNGDDGRNDRPTKMREPNVRSEHGSATRRRAVRSLRTAYSERMVPDSIPSTCELIGELLSYAKLSHPLRSSSSCWPWMSSFRRRESMKMAASDPRLALDQSDGVKVPSSYKDCYVGLPRRDAIYSTFNFCYRMVNGGHKPLPRFLRITILGQLRPRAFVNLTKSSVYEWRSTHAWFSTRSPFFLAVISSTSDVAYPLSFQLLDSTSEWISEKRLMMGSVGDGGGAMVEGGDAGTLTHWTKRISESCYSTCVFFQPENLFLFRHRRPCTPATPKKSPVQPFTEEYPFLSKTASSWYTAKTAEGGRDGLVPRPARARLEFDSCRAHAPSPRRRKMAAVAMATGLCGPSSAEMQDPGTAEETGRPGRGRHQLTAKFGFDPSSTIGTRKIIVFNVFQI